MEQEVGKNMKQTVKLLQYFSVYIVHNKNI